MLPALIDEVLRSILINDEQTQGLLAQEGGAAPVLSVRYGAYRTGLLAGQAPRQESALFIGREARKQYRLQEIARLEGEAAAQREVLAALQLRMEEIEQALRELQRHPGTAHAVAVFDAHARKALGEMLDLLTRWHPELAAGVRAIAADPSTLAQRRPELTRIAIDHAIAEPVAAAGGVAMVPHGLCVAP